MLDFESLNDLLEESHAGTRAADCHGFLCAQACISGSIEEEIITEFLLADANEDGPLEACFASIFELAEEITQQISSSDLMFQLLLPDDYCSLQQRGTALTEWCQGFLSGLGVADLGSAAAMSDAGKELVDDLYEISRLDVDELENADEHEEVDLVELIEYVRMGVIFIYDELQRLTPGEKYPERLH